MILIKTQQEDTAASDYLLNGYDHTILYLPEFDMYLDPTLPGSLPGEFYVNERRFDAYDVVLSEPVDLLDHMRSNFFLTQRATIQELDDKLTFEVSVESFGTPLSDLDLPDLGGILGRYLEIYTKIPENHISIESYEYAVDSTRNLNIRYSVETNDFILHNDPDAILPSFHGFTYPEGVDDCIGHRHVTVSLVNNSRAVYFPTNIDTYDQTFLVRNKPNGIELMLPADSEGFNCDPERLYGPDRDELVFYLYSPQPRENLL